MKHIFSIHSPITYLVALATVEHLKLEDEDVMFLCDGFYLPFRKISTVDFSAYYKKKNKVSQVYALLKNFSKTSLLDNIIDKFIGSNAFTGYVSVMRLVEKTLVTHKRCDHFNFIEEGLAHYYIGETLAALSIERTRESWRWSLSKFSLWKEMTFNIFSTLRGYNFKLRTLPFSYSSYVHFSNVSYYGITEMAFPMANKNKHLVTIPANLKLNIAKFDFDNSIIWIGDNGVDYYGYSKEVYLNGIEKGLIGYLKKKMISTLFVKFHRGENQEMRKEQERLLHTHGIEFIVIPDDYIMELNLVNARNTVLCGVYSSLLFYANAMGHTTLTIYNIIKDEYQKNLEGKNLDFFWNRVKNIDSVI